MPSSKPRKSAPAKAGLADLKRLTAHPTDATPEVATPPSRATRKFLPPGEVAPRSSRLSVPTDQAVTTDASISAAKQVDLSVRSGGPSGYRAANALPQTEPALELSTAERGLFRRVAGAVQRVDTRNRRMPQASPEALDRLEKLERAPRRRPPESIDGGPES